MRCDEMHELISPYADGELGLVTGVEVERHLQDCSVCSREFGNYSALRTAIRTNDLYFKPPAALDRRVRSAVRTARRREAGRGRFGWQWLSAATVVAILLLGGLIAMRLINRASESDHLAQDVVASHIRSLMANHLTDVVSTDQHTVKPWFNGKLDFSPPVKDLASEGFPLVGGRLDYLANRPVAALVYQHRQHYINLFIWPAERVDTGGAKEVTRQGYNVIHWNYEGSSCWAVSDLNNAELQQFVKGYQ
jgi:anti-sigma factor RsiW